MHTHQRSIIGYVLAVVCALVIGSGLMVGATAHAWDQGAHNWAEQKQFDSQLERQQTDQQNQRTMQEWTRPTHPTWNEQQSERAHTPPVSTYNRYDNGPTGTRQQLCMSSHGVTTCQ